MQQIELSDHARTHPDDLLLSDIVTTISNLHTEAVEEQYKFLIIISYHNCKDMAFISFSMVRHP